MYKQIIIARKDLKMSPGKLAAQVSHGSMAFLTSKIRSIAEYKGRTNNPYYESKLYFDKDVFEEWIDGSFTKIVCQAKNYNQLIKILTIAEELGLKEEIDYFLIKDNCLTELQPEEIDEYGNGKTLTCIGFKPLPEEIANKISNKYHLYM